MESHLDFFKESHGPSSYNLIFMVPYVKYIVLYYRIKEWFGLEETFNSHLVQLPCNEPIYRLIIIALL